VPVGGTAGQVLSKINSTDYNTQWIDFTAGTAATGGVYGVTTLTDSVASTSTTTAAVPNSVKTSYDFAATKAKVSVGTAAPVTPSTGDVWVDTAGTATAINAVPLAALTGTGAMIYGAGAGTAATLAIGSTDQQLVVSGGVPAWATSPDIAKSTLTTTGDIIYASGSATPARLGIGTASQVLSVSGGVPAWTTPSSGAMTLISSTTLGTAAQEFTISSIPGTYKHLLLRAYRMKSSTTTRAGMFYRWNGVTTATYSTQVHAGYGFASTDPGGGTGLTEAYFAYQGYGFELPQSDALASSVFDITFYDYAGSSEKMVIAEFGYGVVTQKTRLIGQSLSHNTGTAAVTSITLRSGSATDLIASGAIIDLYGVS
jgi:hypothetical protein